METVTYTQARNNLAKTMNKVNEDHQPILITRQNGDPVVVMSLADYNSIQETAYLLRSPENAERLAQSLKALKGRKISKRKLVSDEE